MGWWCQIPKQEYPYPPSPDRILGEYVVPDTFPDRWVVGWWWWCSHVREQCLYFLPDPVDRWLVGQVSITEKIWPPNSFLFKSSSHPWPGCSNFFITRKYTFSFFKGIWSQVRNKPGSSGVFCKSNSSMYNTPYCKSILIRQFVYLNVK